MKRFIVNVVAIALILMLSEIAIENIKEKNDLIEKLEQQETKIKALQDENASLHDYVWNLNQHLMKEADEND